MIETALKYFYFKLSSSSIEFTDIFCWLCIQLSDFGLAITDGSQNKNNLKLSGTLGYVAPEYLLDGMLGKFLI